MKNRVLLLGDTGMLGQAIKFRLLNDGYDAIGASRTSGDYKVDLRDDNQIRTLFDKVNPDIVINSVAIVSIDGCEENPAEAYLINGRLPGIVAEQCRKKKAYYIQISTDHFFLGDLDKSHNESSKICIVNEYARTKYIGECLSLNYENSVVIRTNVVGFRGKGQETFVEWIIGCMDRGVKMTLYNDFYTSSINSSDFAYVLSDLLKIRPKGIINIASSEVVCKKDFIIELVNEIYGAVPDYSEESIQNVSRVPRADSIGLDTSYVSSLVGYKMPDFKQTIKSIAKDYKERKQIGEI